MIPIYRPYLPKSSLSYAHEALDSGWISSQGKYITMVQERLQELLGVKYVLPLNNGTSACHLIAKCAAELKGKQKVIVQNNVYIAAINAFLFDGNWEIISIDADLETWNYDLEALDRAIMVHPDAAVLIVHNIGNIISVPALQRKYPGTLFLEDACEGFGGMYEGKYAGTASYVSAFSTFANKSITSGEGGFMAFNDEEAYRFAKCVQGQGQSSKRFVHHTLGTNYRMTNIQAGLLMGQLDVLSEILERKETVFARYRGELDGREDVLLQTEEVGTQNANWMFACRIPQQQSYEEAEKFFGARGIEVRPMFYAIDEHRYIRESERVILGEMTNAKELNRTGLILPSFPGLTKQDQMVILRVMNEYTKGL